MNLEKRVKSLEEGFLTFSKFGLKVTHDVATTLQLLAQEKEEAGLDMEDHKLLFKFSLIGEEMVIGELSFFLISSQKVIGLREKLAETWVVSVFLSLPSET